MSWVSFLYYPLGLLPPVFFTARILLQWVASERAGRSVVPSAFWYLSMAGNSLFFLHYVIQCQFSFAYLQMTGALFAWRNLNLRKRPIPFAYMVALLLGATFALPLLFLSLYGWSDWFRAPLLLEQVTSGWTVFGLIGAALFASRFWVQWWQVESQRDTTELSPLFWQLSLGGSGLSCVYFLHIHDWVSLISFSCGMIPYARNLWLLIRPLNREQIP